MNASSVLWVSGWAASLCGNSECPEQSCDDFEPLRRPMFGDRHVHTALSFDANIRGTRLGLS